jgi:hypothetical protein
MSQAASPVNKKVNKNRFKSIIYEGYREIDRSGFDDASYNMLWIGEKERR